VAQVAWPLPCPSPACVGDGTVHEWCRTVHSPA
jgi:hypothetical protein